MADPIATIDRILGELLELRAALAEQAADGKNCAADGKNCNEDSDFAEANLLDTTSAEQRFGHPRNTLAKWARQEGIGVRRGGRWLVSVPRLRRHLNGKSSAT